MANWLDKALGREKTSVQAEPFELECECGTRLSGIRQERAKRVICPQCGDAHFILPVNPYPRTDRVFFSSPDGQLADAKSASTSADFTGANSPDETSEDAASDELEINFAASPIDEQSPPPLNVPPPPPPIPTPTSPTQTSDAVPPPLPGDSGEILSGPLELDLPPEVSRRETTPPPSSPTSEPTKRPDSYDALFDGPLDEDVPDVPLLDAVEHEETETPQPPSPTKKRTKTPSPKGAPKENDEDDDIFNADLSLELDTSINVGGRPLDMIQRDVIVEDSNHELVPTQVDDSDDAIPLGNQPQPIDEYELSENDDEIEDYDADVDDEYLDDDEDDDLVEEAFDERPKKRRKEPRYDYEDIEVAEVVDESYLPDAKKMARGDDRLAEFDHMAEDGVDARTGDRPEGKAKKTEAPGRISLSKVAQKHRKTRIKVFLVLGIMGSVAAGMTFWAVSSGNREQAVVDLREGTENGIAALEAGDFPLASKELRRAVDAQDLLEITTDRAKHIKHLFHEADAAASQSNASLYDIVEQAESTTKASGDQAWEKDFDVNFEGRWVIFLGNIDADNEVTLPAIIGNAPIRIEGIDSLIMIASEEANKTASSTSGLILFAGQLASCGKPKRLDKDGKPIEGDGPDKQLDDKDEADDGQADDFGGNGLAMGADKDAPIDPLNNPALDADQPKAPKADDAEPDDAPKFAPQAVVENVWEVRFKPETAVLWTRTQSLQQLNFIGGDEADDLSKRIKQLVKSQNKAMGFPENLTGTSDATTVAGQ
jgi:hypothetical protein